MRRLVLLSLWAGSLVIAQACGGTTDTDDGGLDSSTNDVVTTQDNFVPPQDGSSPDDVVTIPDAGPDDVVTVPDSGPDTGGKPITSWTCGNATVSDCAQCIGHTQTCVYCADNDASVVSGTCVQTGTGCGNTTPQGFNLCACPHTDGGVSTCPEPYQVCLYLGPQNQPGVCDTCGAVNTTQGLTCNGGGKCAADSGACQ
ncbi:MAG TPA: hypothetical protein VH054_11765 [Polyangiaceae bacterium]|nr:hypothetical protein [Polyangiaceae bacterium]